MQSPAQRLAAQRLQRSEDRLRKTSSSSYGAWYTPEASAPVRRPLTSPSKQAAAAQQEEARRSRLGFGAAPAPAAPGRVAAPAAESAGVSSMRSGTSSAAAAAPSAAAANGNMRGSINLDVQGQQPEGQSSANPPPGATLAAPAGMTLVGAPLVAETSSPAYAVHSKEGSLHVNHDRGATAVLPGEGAALFAMLDGHGQEGALVSGFCQQNLFAAARAALSAGHAPTEAVRYAFEKTAAALEERSGIDCRFSGSTAVLALLTRGANGQRLLTVGFVGDSRAIVGRARPGQAVGANRNPPAEAHAIEVTKDHKPDDPKERQRLQQARAIVRPSRVQNPATGRFVEVGCMRVWDVGEIYGVAMSRSLGDCQCHPFVVSTPDVETRHLDDKDLKLVMATDGVWDVMSNDEAIAIANNGSTPAAAAAQIVRESASRWDKQMPGRRDDITCSVIDLASADLQL